MKGGGHRGRRLVRGWSSALGLFGLVHVLLLAAYALLEHWRLVSLTSVAILAGVFVAALAATFFVCFRILSFADVPREDREARAAGRPATAAVVSVERTRWRIKKNVNFKLEISPRRWEYRIYVRVRRNGEPEYEAEIAEFLPSDQVPKEGDVLDVRVHPQHPDVVVWMR